MNFNNINIRGQYNKLSGKEQFLGTIRMPLVFHFDNLFPCPFHLEVADYSQQHTFACKLFLNFSFQNF